MGPVSAGADPGPACYGIGGSRPTVTDANLLLGYLPAQLAGGSRALSVEAARTAIARDLADPFGLTPEDAACGVRDVVNANMARAIRAVTVERGVDPRDFTLVAIGGSGPVHAADIARLLSMPRVLVPASPGVFTAMGMLAGDVERYFIRPFAVKLADFQPAEAETAFATLEADARTALAGEDVAEHLMSVTREVDMRFRGQEMSLSVPYLADRDALHAAFKAAYEAIYSYSSSDTIEVVSLRVIGRGLRPGKIDFRAAQARGEGSSEPESIRKVYYGAEQGHIDTPVYVRTRCPARIVGPAVIEGADSTVVVPPGATAEADAHANLLITLA